MIGRLSSDNLNITLNDSHDSTFFNPDYIFNDRNNQVCNNFIMIKELNKMFSFLDFLI